MIDFIPLEFYTSTYYNFSLVIVLITLFHTIALQLNDPKNILYIRTVGYFLLCAVILYIGLRPVSGRYFIDMSTYASHFSYYANGGNVTIDKDVFFHYFIKFCANILSLHQFFLLCAFLYIFPLYKVSKTFFKEYWFYAFLIFIVSFSFWTYGVNGIRNGIATSLFLLGVSYYNKKLLMYSIFLISYLFHQSLLLPILAFITAQLYNSPKAYLLGWLAAIPLSLLLGGFWENVFASMGFGDDRLDAYLTNSDSGQRSGFRYDFLIYSASAVFTGWYFIIKRNFDDKIYYLLFSTYLITNAFWILIIRASFSNRFAYLSWFMIGLIIIYPFLKRQFFKKQHMVIGRVLFIYFMFTYLMYFVYYADKNP